MRIYGDRRRAAEPRALVAALAERLERLPAGPGIAHHAELVASLIASGELMQGLADVRFRSLGEDGPDPLWEAGAPLLLALARRVDASWRSGFQRRAPPPRTELARLAEAALPEAIEVVTPEGHAFYAVYPEAYAEAARACGHAFDRVIGVRSIGAGLGAMVAVAGHARRFFTVRPIGHPFDRHIALASGVAATLGPARTAIVDEGPGLSGSSFGAVLDLLAAQGVPERLVTIFPSHDGEPGPMAGEERRARWARLKRQVVDFDRLAIATPRAEHRLEAWLAPLIGAPVAPTLDLSGGAWRARRPEPWPPANPMQERRKFLITTARGRFLAKFVGLGRAGEQAAARAQTLAAAGFTAPLLGFLHGFLVERFLDDAAPLDAVAVDRPALVAAVADYLAFRTRHLPAGAQDGASRAELFEAARDNAAEALGADAARAFDRFAQASDLPIERHATDNKLDRHEWLVTSAGRLVKTDATDHCAGHDLIGCQDLAWDIAGATVELDLTTGESAELRERAAASAGRALPPPLLELARACYLAMRLAAAGTAAQASSGADAARLRQAASHYAARLAQVLSL